MQLDNADGYIKIGFSNDIGLRHYDLQVAIPYKLKIIAIILTPRSTENILHKLLSEYNIRGEWFYPTSEVMEVVKAAQEYKFDEFMENRLTIKKS